MFLIWSRHGFRYITLMFLVVASAILLAAPAYAHPADEINERDFVHIGRDAMTIDLAMSAGAITLRTVWKAADTNGDGTLDTSEREAFGADLARGFTVMADSIPVPTRYDSGSLQIATTLQAFSLHGADAGGATVTARFAVAVAVSTTSEITIAATHFRDADGAKPVELVPSADAPLSLVVQGGTDVNLRVTVATSSTGGPIAAAEPNTSPNDRIVTMLARFVRTPSGGPTYLLFGLCIAALLGALHALTPGHGKTLVTAYLVGTDGRPTDALALGGIITFTHTGSVVVLGVATLVLTRLWTPYRVLPWIECGSSFAIIVLGGWLAWTRFDSVAQGRRIVMRRTASSQIEGAMHEHEDGVVHAHGWFGAHEHRHPPMTASPRTIALVGLSGGILPCPDALAILLIAVAAGYLLAGLLIILAFSAGLAAVLIGLGLLITSTRVMHRLTERTVHGAAVTRWMPTCSAVIMVCVGGGALVRAIAAIT